LREPEVPVVACWSGSDGKVANETKLLGAQRAWLGAAMRGQLLVNWPEQKGANDGKAPTAKGGMVERNGKEPQSVATVFA